MTPEEIRCFCESKDTTVRVESRIGTITYSPKGVEIEPTLFSWCDEPPAPLTFQQVVLNRAKKFIIRPKFGEEIVRDQFERLLMMEKPSRNPLNGTHERSRRRERA